MTDSVDTLSSLTGLSRKFLLDAWADAKLNQERLSACPRHHWSPVGLGLTVKYVCRVCSGTIDSHAHHWYEIGMRDVQATVR